jgi:hypothetical protein
LVCSTSSSSSRALQRCPRCGELGHACWMVKRYMSMIDGIEECSDMTATYIHSCYIKGSSRIVPTISNPRQALFSVALQRGNQSWVTGKIKRISSCNSEFHIHILGACHLTILEFKFDCPHQYTHTHMNIRRMTISPP